MEAEVHVKQPVSPKPSRGRFYRWRHSRTHHAIWKHVKLFALLLLTYLMQVCVMPYVKIGGVTPSLIFVTTAVVTVAFGKLRGFWAGAFFGIVLEAMQPTHILLNLMMYPIIAILCSVLFADKTTQQLDYERSMGRPGRNMTPYLRTPLCTMLSTFLYDLVNIVYIYLRGSEIDSGHIGRGLIDVLLTTLLCVLLMFPLRSFLGVHYERVINEGPKPYQTSGTSRRS